MSRVYTFSCTSSKATVTAIGYNSLALKMLLGLKVTESAMNLSKLNIYCIY